MSARVVLLGFNEADVSSPTARSIPFIEVAPNDAAALVESGMCRVTLTRYNGALSDATVVTIREAYVLTVQREQSTSLDHACTLAWRTARRLLGVPDRVAAERILYPIGDDVLLLPAGE